MAISIQDKVGLTCDNVPTQNSDNAVKSGGVYTALAGKQDAEDTGWQTLQNQTKYRKKNGIVWVRMYEGQTNVPSMTGGQWNNIYTLPTGARPTELINFVITLRQVNGNIVEQFAGQVNTGGAIQMLVPNGTTIDSTTHNAMYASVSFPV